MVVRPARRLFTVAEYNRMGEVGIIGPRDRVELLDGEIVEMTPISPRHSSLVSQLVRLLVLALEGRAHVTALSPAVLDDLTEPEPDLCVARWRKDGYATAHPASSDILLLIEVADSSLAFDLNRKVPRYALAAIPEVWVVDLTNDRIEAFRSPSAHGYADHRTLGRGERLALLAFDDIQLDVTEVLGPPPSQDPQ